MGEVYMEFWWGNRERDHLEDPGVAGRISINIRKVRQVCMGFIWLTIGTRSRLLKLASQEELCSKLVKTPSLEGSSPISHCTARQYNS
jgi:hypothetical protein